MKDFQFVVFLFTQRIGDKLIIFISEFQIVMYFSGFYFKVVYIVLFVFLCMI